MVDVVEIGCENHLQISKLVDFGAYLDGGELGEILLPANALDASLQVGDWLTVFIYRDSEDRLIATTKSPKAQVGEVAWLQIKAVNQIGTFLDWGLDKDLLLPFAEQSFKQEEGKYCLVRLYLDNSGRIAASMKLDSVIKDEAPFLKSGEQVAIIIADKTELGVKAIINHRYWGLLYSDDLPKPVRKGDKLTAYIKRIRPEDNKIDLMLSPAGRAKLPAVAQSILDKLSENNGMIMLTDKSSPEVIKSVFGVSKKVFKQALGTLYKQRLVVLESDRIRDVDG